MYRNFLKSVNQVNEILNGLDYVFIKLHKPITYVPADIDILLCREAIPKAISRLKGKGLRVEVAEPYCVTMVRERTIVDLYLHPTLGGIIYLNTRSLSTLKEIVEFYGIEIPALKTYAEVLIAAVHAIYKERIYTLNDYVTLSRWCNEKTVKLAEELHSLDALREALTIHRLVEKRKTTLPYKVPYSRWIALLWSKFMRDKQTRSTLLNITKTLRDKRFGALIKSKLCRETY